MTSTIIINDGSGRTTTPRFVYRPYSTERESRNIITDLIGGDLAIAIIPARPRADRLICAYLTEEAAAECVDMHAQGATFTLVSDDAATIGMTYVLQGTASYRQADEVDEWIAEIGYQEIVT